MTTPAPMVTIGMPVYNGARFLRGALDMLLGQTFRDFELIVSDNASTDETPEICAEYGARDGRVRYVRQATNLGAAGNFNYLLSQRAGKYFMFAPVDDRWSPALLERMLAAMEEDEGIAIAFPSFVYIGVDGRELGGSHRVVYPDASPVARLARFALAYKDHCFYGLMRSCAIGDGRLVRWWGPVRDVLHDNAYPFLCGVIARGRVVCPSSDPLFQSRVWPHEYEGEKYFPGSYALYVMLKVNVLCECLRRIRLSSRSVPLTVAVFPFFLLRAILECFKRPRYAMLAWGRFRERCVAPVRIWFEQHLFWRFMKR